MKKINYSIKFLCSLMLVAFTFAAFVSCQDDDAVEPNRNLSVDLTSATMRVGNDLVLTPIFSNYTSQQEYEWEVSDSSVIVISNISRSYEATISAIGEGTATATIRTLDGNQQASTTIETTLVRETEVDLPESITAYTRATVTITPDFNPVDVPTRTYTWSSSQDGIVSIETNPETYEVEIQGLSVGTTELRLSSNDGEVVGTTTVTVEDENDGILKILAIGNSFSEDALEYYLYGLAEAANKEIVIGNLYIGGAQLSQHVENANSNAESYSYRKIDLSGNKTTTNNVSIATALANENWDYISLQQVSQNSGMYDTFVSDLPALYDYVNDRMNDDGVRYLLHQTWAYAQNSTHSGFPNYNSDQITMYEAIVNAYDMAQALIPAYAIVPSGTAIQNARTSYLGDNFNRDGYHLNEIGRYTAASTWFEILFNESVVGNSYMPDAFTPIDIEIAQNAAHEAVQMPKEITELTNYQNAGGDGVITNNVYVNFGNAASSSQWNNLDSFLEGATVPNLKYANGQFTGIELAVSSRFNGVNTNGESQTNTELNMPVDVSGNSFFGNSKAPFSGRLVETGVIILTGFEADDAYDFCFFGSRTATDNRETQYTVIGANTGSSAINTASNTDNLACISGIRPNSNGEITIEVTAGPNNTNSSGFFYINAMRISPQE